MGVGTQLPQGQEQRQGTAAVGAGTAGTGTAAAGAGTAGAGTAAA